MLVSTFVVQHPQRQLTHVVAASDSSGCFTYLLNGGQKHSNQDADDRNDH